MSDKTPDDGDMDSPDILKKTAEELFALTRSDYNQLISKGLSSEEIKKDFKIFSKAFDKGDWDIVENMAGDISKRSKELLSDWHNATKALENITILISQVSKSVDMKKVNESLTMAEDMMEKGDYISVLESVAHIEELLADINEDRRPFVALAFSKRPLISGKWNRTRVNTINEGNSTAKNVEFQLSGPVEVLRFNPLKTLKPGERRTMEIAIKSEEEGEIPLDIRIVYQRDSDETIYQAEGVKWINFVSPEDMATITGEDQATTLSGIANDKLSLKKSSEHIAGKLKESYCYLIHEETSQRTFEIFSHCMASEKPGLCLTRTFPKRIYEIYQIEGTRVIWLTNVEGRGMLRPSDLEKIRHTIRLFLKDNKEGIILLDGVEYLITHNKYESVLKFIQSLKDQVAINKSILLIPASPQAMDNTQIKLLEREVDEILK